jgi:TRAP-type mannitol/chloroaromatic compound transport system permease large subunit
MSVLSLGLLFGGATLVVMFSGMPIAFALGFVAVLFMAAFMPASSLDTVTQNVYEEMSSITLLSIPLFILKGAAIGRSNAGRDLYLAMHAWMQRIPGGLGIANVFTCALFAAMAGSSPATCSAIGSAGIPEMRKRGYSPGFAAGHHRCGRHARDPAAAVDHDDPVRRCGGSLAGPIVSRGYRTRDLLVALFALYAMYKFRREYAVARAAFERDGTHSAYLEQKTYTLYEKVEMLRACLPFVILLIGVMVALYGGYATPSETAGLGAVLALALIADHLSRVATEGPEADPCSHAQGIDDADVHHRHVAAVLLRHELPAHQPVVGAGDRRDASVEVAAAGDDSVHGDHPRLLPAAGLDHPDDRADHPSTAQAAGFDLIWFGVLMTIVMEMGLIHPPVGSTSSSSRTSRPTFRCATSSGA